MTVYDPTPRLRWVERDNPDPEYGPLDFRDDTPFRVLQYGLRPINGGDWHWFDVPVEKEEPQP